jgi:AraC-like DNA-binding protein
VETSFPFSLPFIRWADVAIVTSRNPTSLRRLYDHELVYVLAGGGRIRLGDETFQPTADQLFLIPPRTWHAFHADDGAEFPLLGVHFDWVPQHDTLAFPLHRDADEPVEAARFRESRRIPHWDAGNKPFLDLKGRPRVRRALEEVVTEYNKFDEESLVSSGALLAAAMALISREARALQQLKHSTAIGADALRRVQRARELLESPSTPAPAIEDVAAQVGWSGDHLRRMFRLVLDTSPYHIQTAARLQRAKVLLRGENLSIAEVALRCGFEDASHFSRVFKKESGLSPRQYLALSKKI